MLPDHKQRLLKYLQDALSAADELYKETMGLSPGNFYFNNIKWLVERGIEILSEALKRASILYPDLPITDLNKIFATRNKIAHEYDIVDPLLLYNIVSKHIPILIGEIKSLMVKLENSND